MSKTILIVPLLLLTSCASKIVDKCDCDGQVSLKNVSVEDCNKICDALNHKCDNHYKSDDEVDCEECIENFVQNIDESDAGF